MATNNGSKLSSPQDLAAAQYLSAPRYSFEAFAIQWGFSVILNNAHISLSALWIKITPVWVFSGEKLDLARLRGDTVGDEDRGTAAVALHFT